MSRARPVVVFNRPRESDTGSYAATSPRAAHSVRYAEHCQARSINPPLLIYPYAVPVFASAPMCLAGQDDDSGARKKPILRADASVCLAADHHALIRKRELRSLPLRCCLLNGVACILRELCGDASLHFAA